jgi:hypothetical protein
LPNFNSLTATLSIEDKLQPHANHINHGAKDTYFVIYDGHGGQKVHCAVDTLSVSSIEGRGVKRFKLLVVMIWPEALY